MYNLGEQFINKNKDKLLADSKSIIQGTKYRIEVLTDRLVRFEYSNDGKFNDYETSIVKNRIFPVPEFKKSEDEKTLIIETKYMTVIYSKEMPFSSRTLTAKYDEKKIWVYGQKEVRNLHGNTYSLDAMYNLPDLKNGLFSLDGFATIDDSNSLCFDEYSNVYANNKNIDLYLFIYNNDFNLALQDYYGLTGYPPLIPRYALGNWWSKEYAYNEDGIMKLINKFQIREIPLSIILLDNGWAKKDSNYPNVKVGYTFDSSLYSNPISFVQKVHKKGIKLGVKINPGLGFYPFETNFSVATKYLKTNKDGYIDFNIYDMKNIDVLFKCFIHPLEQIGVDLFWNNYNPHDLNKMYLMNYYMLKDSYKNNKRFLMLSRNSTYASHLFNVMYSGHNPVDWRLFKVLPFYNLTSSNIGADFISHDVGGSIGGVEDNELYVRSVELGVFSPILRFNTEKGKYFKREPWKWDLVTNNIACNYLRLRHKLIPYLYSEAFEYHKKGKLLIEPFYYHNLSFYDDENYVNQYYFGSAFMISPIIREMDPVINRTIQRFYIPDGVWYDFTTGKRFMGNRKYIAFYKLEEYPIFVKQGSIIPLAGEESYMRTDNPTDLEIQVFPGKSNTYYLYEDDGLTYDYQDGKRCVTEIDYNYRASNYTVIIRNVEGDLSVIPEIRNYKIVFRNTKKSDNIVVYENDKEKKDIQTEYTDTDFIVYINNVKTSSQLVVNCYGKDIEIDSLKLIKDDIDSILYDLKIDTVLKNDIANIVFNEEEILSKKRIAIKKLKRKGLDPRSIKVFLKLLEYMEM